MARGSKELEGLLTQADLHIFSLSAILHSSRSRISFGQKLGNS
jgi:hypothetical protein